MKHNRLTVLISLMILAAILGACTIASSETEQTVFVAPTSVACDGGTSQKCLLVSGSESGPWEASVESIDGFEYEPGSLYELRVSEDENGTLVLEDIVAQRPMAVATIFIGPQQIPCFSQSSQLCYLYKEDAEDSWSPLNSEIVGFNHEEGYEYELLVGREEIEDEATGQRVVRYLMFQDISKSAVPTQGNSGMEALEGTSWQVTSLNGRPVLEGTELTMHIAGGEVSGSAGCNTFSGPLSQNGETLFGALSSTRKACEPAVNEQELDYLAALQAATDPELGQNTMSLFDAGGNEILAFALVEAATLEDTLWELNTYNTGQNAVETPLEGTRVTAQLQDGSISGTAGCNHYSGSYQLEGSTMTISTLVRTEIFCMEPEGVMEQEDQFLAALESAAEYRITADRLELFNGEGELAAAFAAAKDRLLDGTQWQVNAYFSGEMALANALEEAPITLAFADGSVTGSTGCNSFGAGYEAGEETITIDTPESTLMFCETPDGVMDQESQFLELLPRATAYELDGDQLVLLDDAGIILLQMTLVA